MAHERHFQRSQRRRTGWRGGPNDNVQTQTAGGKVLGNSMPLADGETIARIRGNFEIIVDGVAAMDGCTGAFGMGVLVSDAVGAGTTAVPGPDTDPDWEGWIVHKYFNVHALVANSTVRQDFDFDSKAMRKGSANAELFAMVEVTEQGNMTIDYYYNCRVLVMLP